MECTDRLVRLRRPHKAGLEGEHDRLDAIAESQLCQNPAHVRLHGCLRDEEALADFHVREPFSHRDEHFTLSTGQPAEHSRDSSVTLCAAREIR